MKGRRAIRFRQWLAITVSNMVSAVLLVCYDYFTMMTPLVEKPAPNFPWFNYFLLNIIAATLAGGLISGFMVYYLQDRFRDKPYGHAVLVLLLIMLTVMIIATVPYYMIQATMATGHPISDPETMKLFRKLFNKIDPGYFILLPLMAMQQIMLQISNKFGPGVLWKIIKGTYNTPKIENRIFMFADLNDSTTIAENLSDERYHEFLKNFYSDITTSILNHSGEIYQYLGDGIILVWKYHGNEKDLFCIDCFFDMKKEIAAKEEKYKQKFGTIPTFKAGVHCGKVVVGEIGIIKRDISYSGDVVNTASRIQSMCKQLESELLVSSELHRSFPPLSNYETKSVGSIHLKGKLKEVELRAVRLK